MGVPQAATPYQRGGVLVEGGGESIVGAWNAVLMGEPLMRHWTVEQLMARVNKVERIDLG